MKAVNDIDTQPMFSYNGVLLVVVLMKSSKSPSAYSHKLEVIGRKQLVIGGVYKIFYALL